MRLLWLILALAVAYPANASEKLKGDQINATLLDVSLYGTQNGAKVEQIFQKSGTTFYLVNGASSIGQWEVRNDQYCSVWPPNPTWSCYDVYADVTTVTFVDKHQQVFIMQKNP
jgi:hypothetical protein